MHHQTDDDGSGHRVETSSWCIYFGWFSIFINIWKPNNPEQGRALRARPADAARRPTDAERAPPARGAPPEAENFRAPHAQKLHRKHDFRPLRPSPPPCPEPHFRPDFGCKFAQEWVRRGWEKNWHVPLANPKRSPPNGVKMRHFNV